VAQNTANTLLEKPGDVNISIPAVREAIFIAELNTNESFGNPLSYQDPTSGKATIVTLIMTNHAFRLCRIRTLELYPGRSDDHMMTRNMSLVCKPKWLDIDMFGTQACKIVLHSFVRFAHPHREQPQELRCLITVIVDCLFDGFLERLEQLVGGKQTSIWKGFFQSIVLIQRCTLTMSQCEKNPIARASMRGTRIGRVSHSATWHILSNMVRSSGSARRILRWCAYGAIGHAQSQSRKYDHAS
jgi:hypothetical protein